MISPYIIQDVENERLNQSRTHGYTWEHDLAHTPGDWVATLAVLLGRYAENSCYADKYQYSDARKALVKIAAVAIAALEVGDAGRNPRAG